MAALLVRVLLLPETQMWRKLFGAKMSEVQWIDGFIPNVFPGFYTTSNSKCYSCYHVKVRWCVPVAALVGGIAPDT